MRTAFEIGTLDNGSPLWLAPGTYAKPGGKAKLVVKEPVEGADPVLEYVNAREEAEVASPAQALSVWKHIFEYKAVFNGHELPRIHGRPDAYDGFRAFPPPAA